ncbi:MAG: helix-turn-helix domain-containing protein [Fibrobacterota bacterium]|nr:helix-turn-helix domain-containing protein [Fibrobacterota bacterium]
MVTENEVNQTTTALQSSVAPPKKNLSLRVDSHGYVALTFDPVRFSRALIDRLNKKKDNISLLLVEYKSDQASIFFNEFVHRLSEQLFKRTISYNTPEVYSRVMGAISAGAVHDLIAHAYIYDNKLIVIDCAARRLEIEQKHLKSVSVSGLISNEFNTQPDGSYLYWPKYDYHINLNGLRSKVDDKFRKSLSVKHLVENQKLGRAIKRLREEANLKQSDIHEFSERQISRIETGVSLPNYSTFEILSRHQKMSIDEYLKKVSSYLG